MNQKILNEKIRKFVDIENESFYEFKYELKDIKFEKIRDSLYKIGNILEMDVENKLLIVNIKSGMLNLIQTFACLFVENNNIYYKIFNENGKMDETSAKKIVDKLNKIIGVKKSKKNFKRKIFIIILLTLSIILCYFFFFYKITREYNDKVNEYNQRLVQYKKDISVVDVSNIDSFQNVLDRLDIVDINFITLCNSIKKGNSIKKVKSDIMVINSEINKINKNTEIVKKINNPNVEEVYSKIRNIPKIRNAEIVDEEEKNSDLFHYDGMFKDCLYFTLSNIEDDVKGNTPVEKGTDAGGCIEIYENLQKARNRYDYLLGFDNTIYYSGQFICVGTMIIRTSYKLSNELNKEIVNLIIGRLIN